MQANMELVRTGALADAYALLAILVEFPTVELAQGLCAGAVQRDLAGIAREAGFYDAVEDVLGRCTCDDAGAQDLLKEMRVEHTRLFEHPEEPAVGLYEALFLHAARAERAREHPAQVDAPVRRGPRPGRVFGGGEDAPGAQEALRALPGTLLDDRPRMFVNPAALDAERCYRAAGLVRAQEKNVPADSMVTELQFMAYLHARLVGALQAGDEELARSTRDLIAEFERIHLRKWAQAFFEKTAAESRIEAYRLAGAYGAALFAQVLAARP